VNYSRHFIAVMSVILFGVAWLPIRADYLTNSDLKQGFAWWHGDGEPAFLNPDGTEGSEGDKDVIPVIKIHLSKGESRSVYQEYETKDAPKSLHVTLQVYASDDFKRSAYADDYSSDINWRSTGTYYSIDQEIPNADFWIHDVPSGLYQLSDLKPSEWTSIDCSFDCTTVADERTLFFNAPPGEGTIYIRKASVVAQ
jgi:hypothetical protein